MRRFVTHLTAILGAGALVLALAACSGGDGTTADTAEVTSADSGSPADDEGDSASGSGADAGEDEGTVTVVVASGSHAGTYTRSGNLQCTNFGDGRWIVFAPGQGADDEVASLELYYLPGGIDADSIDTPYPGEHGHLSISFGSPIASGDNQIIMEDNDGGSLELAVPSLDDTMRPIHNFVATTADGVSMTISAAVADCPSY